MNERSEPGIGRCEACGRAYRVPDRDRAYACKACDGAVRVPADPAEERRAAAAELRRVHGWIEAVVWLHRLGALAYAGVTLLAVLALARTEVPLGPGLLVVALATTLTVAMAVGAIRILFQPLVWTVVVAALATAVSVAHLIGPNPLGLAFAWSAAWAGALWLSVWPAWRLARLMERHKDMYVMHHAGRGTLRSLKGRTPEERHERLMRAMRRAGRRAWRVSAVAAAVVVLASAVGTAAVVGRLRPEERDAAIGAFEDAWAAGDVQAVGERILPQVRAQELARLEGFADGFGWSGLPALGAGDVRELDGRVRVDYWVDDVLMSVFWGLHERRWHVLELDLPRPPFEPAFDAFLAAWGASDLDAIVALFPAGHRERMRASIEASLDRRGWDPLPKVLASEVASRTDEEVRARLVVLDGEVTTRWRFRADARWGLHAIRFPR